MKKLIYCFDLDGTLCTNTDGSYELAKPYLDRIRIVNDLYDKGHFIIIDTARGSTTNIDWTEFTKNQLHRWGLKFHKVRAGVKFKADLYIDDKGMSVEDFFKSIIK
jgi:hypothetical protein